MRMVVAQPAYSPALLLLAIAVGAIGPAAGQLSNAIAKDGDLEPNPFRDSSPLAVEEIIFGDRSSNHSQCFIDLRLRWTAEVGSGLYSSPAITDLYSDGTKEIVAAGFTRYVEAIDGATGASTLGWPFVFDRSSFHSSPLLHDVDGDGVQEVVVATNDAEIVFLRENGTPLHAATLKVPPLSVRKNWYKGLDEDHTTRRLLSVHSDYIKPATKGQQQGAWGGGLSKGGIESLDLLREPELDRSELASESWQQADPLGSAEYRKRVKELMAEAKADSSDEHVLVDAHLMATPSMADLDGDGNPELIVSVSYYFDREEMSDKIMHPPVAADVHLSKYVAGGIVVFDMEQRRVKWSQHLDLTTDTTNLRAYIYTSPTIVDMDGDGKLDVVVGTSVGFIYVLDEKGRVFAGFPVQIGEIQGSIAAEDITGDGKLDLIAADASGNVVCLSSVGEVQWERKISGFGAQGVTIGDIDGDNRLDVVLGTTSGHVWALSGQSGQPLEGFPVKTGGKVVAPVLLTQLKHQDRGNDDGVMQLVVPSFDGGVYLIDGKGKCIHRVDIGESAYGMVLAEDVTQDGKLDLVVGTMAGNLFVFGTSMNMRPGLAWGSQGLGTSHHTSKLWQGIEVSSALRRHRDVLGSSFVVQFEIVDRSHREAGTREYRVTISLGGSVELLTKIYTAPGVYTEVLPTPAQRGPRTVVVRMTNQFGQRFEDAFSLSFNVHFYQMLKWMLFLPFAITAVVTLAYVKAGDREGAAATFKLT